MRTLFFILITLLSACSQSKSSSGDSEMLATDDAVSQQPPVTDSIRGPFPNSSQEKTISVKTFSVEAGGYGYDIYIDGTKVIHQPHRPEIVGNQGFETEEKARKVADLVASKVRNNIMPPAVTQQELDSLGVL